MKWGVAKLKHPNKGHTPNKGQKPMYQGVRYSESPLYMHMVIKMQLKTRGWSDHDLVHQRGTSDLEAQ